MVIGFMNSSFGYRDSAPCFVSVHAISPDASMVETPNNIVTLPSREPDSSMDKKWEWRQLSL